MYMYRTIFIQNKPTIDKIEKQQTKNTFLGLVMKKKVAHINELSTFVSLSEVLWRMRAYNSRSRKLYKWFSVLIFQQTLPSGGCRGKSSYINH